MNIKEKQEFLSRVGIFAGCKSGDLKSLAKTCREMEFAPGEVICQQGEKGSALYIIVVGRVEATQERTDGSVIRLAELGEESVIGELAVIDGEQRSATVIAIEETKCLVLTSWDLMATIKDRPLIALDILRVIISRYRTLAERIRTVNTVE